MKEKEVYLTSEEIEYLLKGVIHWDDIENRITVKQRSPIEIQDTERKHENYRKSTKKNSPNPKLRNSVIPDKKALEGSKVYFILTGVGILTLGTWIYFVFT